MIKKYLIIYKDISIFNIKLKINIINLIFIFLLKLLTKRQKYVIILIEGEVNKNDRQTNIDKF